MAASSRPTTMRQEQVLVTVLVAQKKARLVSFLSVSTLSFALDCVTLLMRDQCERGG